MKTNQANVDSGKRTQLGFGSAADLMRIAQNGTSSQPRTPTQPGTTSQPRQAQTPNLRLVPAATTPQDPRWSQNATVLARPQGKAPHARPHSSSAPFVLPAIPKPPAKSMPVVLPPKAKQQVSTPAAAKESRWKPFEDIGLRPKAAPTKNAAKLAVSTYRIVGFGILTVVVVVLVSYLATSLFYLVNRTWMVPVVLSPTDEKVVELKTELAAQTNEREQLASALRDAERNIADQRKFQAAFAKTIKSDLAGRQAALAQLRSLARKAAQTRHEIARATSTFASSHDSQIANEYAAGLIDRDRMVAGKYQLAEIATSKLSAEERQQQLDQQAADLAVQTRSLDALLNDRGSDVALSYEVLKIKRELDQSKAELARAIEHRDALAASLARKDQILAELSGSVYLRAVREQATVAMLPYANLSDAKPGAALYACRLGMVWCREVGRVLSVMPGEVQVRHPHRDKMMRGQMLELRMTDASATHDDVLFVGKPLGL